MVKYRSIHRLFTGHIHIRLVFIVWWEAVVHTVQLSEACSELAPSVVLRTQNRVITVTARMPRLSLVGRIKKKKKKYNKLIPFQSFAVVYPYDNSALRGSRAFEIDIYLFIVLW